MSVLEADETGEETELRLNFQTSHVLLKTMGYGYDSAPLEDAKNHSQGTEKGVGK